MLDLTKNDESWQKNFQCGLVSSKSCTFWNLIMVHNFPYQFLSEQTLDWFRRLVIVWGRKLQMLNNSSIQNGSLICIKPVRLLTLWMTDPDNPFLTMSEEKNWLDRSYPCNAKHFPHISRYLSVIESYLVGRYKLTFKTDVNR